MRERRPDAVEQSNDTLRTDGGTEDEDDSVPADERDESDRDIEVGPVERLLRSGDVLELEPDASDLRLTEGFERAWRERIEQMRSGDRAIRWLAASREIDPGEITVSEDEPFVLTHNGEEIGRWHSRAAFLATLVVEPVLNEWLSMDDLAELPDESRHELPVRLTMFLEQCPVCDETLEFTEEVEEDATVSVSLDCAGCGGTVASGFLDEA